MDRRIVRKNWIVRNNGTLILAVQGQFTLLETVKKIVRKGFLRHLCRAVEERLTERGCYKSRKLMKRLYVRLYYVILCLFAKYLHRLMHLLNLSTSDMSPALDLKFLRFRHLTDPEE